MQSKTEQRSPYEPDHSGLETEFDITHEDIEKAFQDFVKSDESQKEPRDRGLVNTLSVFGGVMLVVTILFGLQMLGLDAGPDISFTQHVIGPSLLALFTLLIWSGISKRKRNKKKNKTVAPKLKVRPAGANKTYSDGKTSAKDGNYDSYAFTKKKQLRRSRKDKRFLGVCGGIADYFGFDPTVVRILFGLSMAFYGTPILLYFLLAIVMKKEPE
ncbi:MAG: PspC domain-containing protein [Balneolia bacterium]|nr:PspC domain-containing protein [Balneolia bacterium]